MRTITSRELERRTGGAKRATENGPVVITQRGKPAFVLVTIEDYRRMMAQRAGVTPS